MVSPSPIQLTYGIRNCFSDKREVIAEELYHANHPQLNNTEMKNQCSVKVEQASLPSLPTEMIGNILSYLVSDSSCFWQYGLICTSFLREVSKIMKERNMHIKVCNDETFESNLDFICNHDDVAAVVGELGLDLSNNKNLANSHLRTILERCNKIKVLNLSFCNLTDESVMYLENLSELQRIDLSCCSSLNDKNLTILTRGCAKLKHLNLLMCENVSDIGKNN